MDNDAPDVMKQENDTTKEKLFLQRKLSDEQVRFYEENGYLLYGPILTDAGLDRLREDSMAVWQGEDRASDGDETWLQSMLLPNVHRRAETVRRFYFSGPLVEVAEQLIGPDIKAANSQLSFKLAGDTNVVGWHQDNGYGELDPYNALTCLTALDTADEESGCLWVIPEGHKAGQIDVRDQFSIKGKQAQGEIKLDVDESRAIPVPLKPGECVVFHAWMPHKSEANRSDHDRRLLFARYADADSVEVYNDRTPRLGRLLRGSTRFPEVEAFEADLP